MVLIPCEVKDDKRKLKVVGKIDPLQCHFN